MRPDGSIKETILLLNEAEEAARQAYCPYSRFKVGAALLSADGRIFRGCNIENASFGLTVCAERSAFFAAIAAGARDFSRIAIVAGGTNQFPCGACLQIMTEFCGSSFEIIMAPAGQTGDFITTRLGDLLTSPFKLESTDIQRTTRNAGKN